MKQDRQGEWVSERDRIAELEKDVAELRALLKIERDLATKYFETLQQIASFAPEVTHHWADHVREVAKQALTGD